MKMEVYSQKGTKKGDVTLPEDVFDVQWNGDLVHSVLVSMEANARTHTAHTKDRSEVRGGGIKPWRQKGTGRARHGSIRSPLWAGGGVTFGPRNERVFSKKINKKERRKALFIALSQKVRDGEVLFVDALDLPEAKTKHAKTFFDGLGAIKGSEEISTRRKNRALIVMPEATVEIKRSFRNMSNVSVKEAKDISVHDIVSKRFLVFVEPEKVINTLKERRGTAPTKKVDKKTKETS